MRVGWEKRERVYKTIYIWVGIDGANDWVNCVLTRTIY